MKLSDLLRQELAKRGLTSNMKSARFLGVSTEFVRMTLHKNHVPKDTKLVTIAGRLGIDATPLILAAHQQMLPLETQSSILPRAEAASNDRRRWPLSREQCDYLAKVISPQEIQILRKYRQLLPEGKIQTQGYIHYIFATNRVPQPTSSSSDEAIKIETR
jgi:hypothetical protein